MYNTRLKDGGLCQKRQTIGYIIFKSSLSENPRALRYNSDLLKYKTRELVDLLHYVHFIHTA